MPAAVSKNIYKVPENRCLYLNSPVTWVAGNRGLVPQAADLAVYAHHVTLFLLSHVCRKCLLRT